VLQWSCKKLATIEYSCWQVTNFCQVFKDWRYCCSYGHRLLAEMWNFTCTQKLVTHS
jgi:hypothetical protein